MLRDYAKYVLTLVAIVVFMLVLSIICGFAYAESQENKPCGIGNIIKSKVEYNDYYKVVYTCDNCDYVESFIYEYPNYTPYILFAIVVILGLLTYHFMHKAYKEQKEY